MAKITIHEVNAQSEKDTITGLIVSDKFCNNIIPITKLDYFTSSHMKTIVSWVLEYYTTYKKAPNKVIQEIYKDKRVGLDQTDANLIEGILDNLARKYDNDKFDEDYVIKQAIEFFNKRKIETIAGKVKDYLDQGSVRRASRELKKFEEITLTRELESGLSKKDTIITFMEELKEKEFLGIPTGYPILDDKLKGLRYLSILGGETSTGKSAFAHNIEVNLALMDNPIP